IAAAGAIGEEFDMFPAVLAGSLAGALPFFEITDRQADALLGGQRCEPGPQVPRRAGPRTGLGSGRYDAAMAARAWWQRSRRTSRLDDSPTRAHPSGRRPRVLPPDPTAQANPPAATCAGCCAATRSPFATVTPANGPCQRVTKDQNRPGSNGRPVAVSLLPRRVPGGEIVQS